jgi:hypothetical protein
MDTYFPATIVASLDLFRQHFPAQHFAYFRGYVWALAMLGTTRKCMTNMARSCVFVERHLASWERFLGFFAQSDEKVYSRSCPERGRIPRQTLSYHFCSYSSTTCVSVRFR